MAREKNIFEVVESNDRRGVEALLSRGADINARDEQKRTPLHIAVCKGSLDMVRFLISKGADINAKDGKGWSPPAMASHYGRGDMVDLLMSLGAKSDKEISLLLGDTDFLRGQIQEFVAAGDRMSAEGHMEEALESYRKVLKIEPHNSGTHRNILNILWLQGEYEQAVKQYLDWARACREARMLEEAFRIYQEILELEDRGPKKSILQRRRVEDDRELKDLLGSMKGEIHYHMGMISMALGNMEDSIRNLRVSVDLNPLDARLHMALGEAYAKCAMDREAIGELQEVVRLAPSEAARAYEMLGEIYLRSGKGGGPQGSVVWMRNAADLYEQNQQPDDAIRINERILALVPDNEYACERLVDIYEKKGMPKKSIHNLLRLAEAHAEKGHSDRLISSYEKILGLDPGNSDVHEKLLLALRKMLKSDPQNSAIRQKLINYLIEGEMLGQAIEELEQQTDIYLKKGMLEEALGECKKIALLDQDNVKAHESMAEICLRLGSRDEARAAYIRLAEILRNQGKGVEAREIEKEIIWKCQSRED